VRRNPKAKLDIDVEVPLQLVEERAVAVVDNDASNMSLEKRKEDASKPLYIKRV